MICSVVGINTISGRTPCPNSSVCSEGLIFITPKRHFNFEFGSVNIGNLPATVPLYVPPVSFPINVALFVPFKFEDITEAAENDKPSVKTNNSPS